jgi:hypothetical protein
MTIQLLLSSVTKDPKGAGILTHLQQTCTGVDGIERVGKDKRQDSHQLHDNV